MKKKIYLLVSLLVLLSMLLSACGGETATPTEAPTPVEPTEAPTEPEPTEAPEEPEVVEPEVLDPAFLDENYSTMLANMQGYNTIKADGLMEMIVAEEPFFLLDVRTTAEVEEKGHITGAAHMPLENLTMALNMLPGPNDPIVVYCGSGWRATIAMTSLHGMGWTNVRALKTSFADWVEAGNPVTEGLPGPFPANMMAYPQPLLDTFDASLAIYGVKPYGGIDAEGLNTALVESPDMIVIDVRTPEELEEKGTIDTGDVELLTIPLQDFIAQQAMWPADLDAQITIYCGSGHRSTMALAILGSYGYTNVTSLKGGFSAWAEGGYPVVGGTMAAGGESVADWPINQNFQVMLENMVMPYNTIKADALMEMIVAEEQFVLLDVRTTAEVEEKGHITGAIHMPLENLTQALNMLGGTDTPIVVYCGSGWRATIAMTSLHGMGWTDVRALKTSFADWVEAGNPVTPGLPGPQVANTMAYPEELTGPFDASLAIYGVKPYGGISADDLNLALADSPDMYVIDVRTEGEVQDQGYIAATNWSHIALQDFITKSELWPADKDAQIVIYCGSGHRSTMALAILGANGYTNVSSLKLGFGGWVGAGYPVAGAKAAFAANFQAMLETMEGYNTIKADGLMEQMVADAPPFILDVRTTAEVEEQGHIEGAVHIPLNELAQNLSSLPAYTTPIVTYCGSGWRATIAMTALHGMGWENVKALKAKFSDWVEAGNPVGEGLPEPSMVASMVEFDPDMVAALDAMLQVYGVKPFGGIAAEDFNTALAEKPEMVVMDVRTAEELADKGTIDTGDVELITIPIQDFIAQMSEWPAADAETVVYCGSDHRSTMALAMMGILNYDTVSSLKGGFTGWVEAGFPVVEYAAP